MINLDNFGFCADRDGTLYLSHDEPGCFHETELREENRNPSIARAIELAEEHLKVCPLRIVDAG